ncbi:MAG: DciA family protein [Pseudomonadota bacterium]
MTPARITRFISADWAARSGTDRQLGRALEGLLGPELRTGRVSLTLNGDTLVAICADRGLATELRFQQRELLKTLEAAGYTGVHAVRTQLARTPRPRPIPSPSVRREIPDTARELLDQTAANVADPGLSAALARLARAARPDDDHGTRD